MILRSVLGGSLMAASLLSAGAAEALPCRLALAMALDISSSVNSSEYDIQLKGLVAALRDPAIREAILVVPGAEVQVLVYEWSGYVQQDLIVGWTALSSLADIDALANRIDEHRRTYADFPTAIGKALEYALFEFNRLPKPCAREVIDISGDGVNNDGLGATMIWPALAARNITVNALVIAGASPDPVYHYQYTVITGPEAFMLVARNGFEDYPDLIKGKLLREFAPVMMIGENDVSR